MSKLVGGISDAEMNRVFNNGIMVISIVDQDGTLPDDPDVIEIGEAVKRSKNEPQVELVSRYCD